jgi:hypothetical protein
LIYLIGGPGRCGKTELALRLLRAHSLPIFSTDLFGAFMTDLDAGGADTTAPWSDDEWMARFAKVEAARERLRLHLPNVVWAVRGVYGSGIVEGVEILPDCIPRLADLGEVCAVFLVRRRVDLEDLVAHSDRHDWLRSFGQPVKEALMAEILSLSTDITERAERLQLPVVDVSQDFDAAMVSAAAALGLPLESCR